MIIKEEGRPKSAISFLSDEFIESLEEEAIKKMKKTAVCKHKWHYMERYTICNDHELIENDAMCTQTDPKTHTRWAIFICSECGKTKEVKIEWPKQQC